MLSFTGKLVDDFRGFVENPDDYVENKHRIKEN